MTDLEKYCKTVYEPADVVELRLINKRDDVRKKKWTFAKDMPQMETELKKLNQQGYCVYVGPNPRKSKGLSGDDNVLLARCLFCDFDHIEPLDGCGPAEFVTCEIIEAGLPEPNLVINSGHGIHTYWRLSEPITDMNRWRQIQEKLNHTLKADSSIKNAERIMRLPGFLNLKFKPFVESFIVYENI
ncbi:MAG: hypothetical protein H8D56_05380 [Planctomycetes bacterium]|nr:hypothetical protein [Planctomycetota bacterium]MBL7145822.1 hypothetical protein [Phycisphaerae bacterium]